MVEIRYLHQDKGEKKKFPIFSPAKKTKAIIGSVKLNKEQKKAIHSFLSLTLMAVLIAGVLFVFQYAISWIEEFLSLDFEATALNITLYFFGIVLLSVLEYFLMVPPFYKGNVAAMVRLVERKKKVPFLKGIVSVFLCCLISFLIGVPLGGEGPSVFIGALLAEGLFLWSHNKEEILSEIEVGAGTGYATAFLNPLAGFFYFVEHSKKNRKKKKLFKAGYVLLVSYFLMVLFRFLQGNGDPFHYSLFRDGLEGMQSFEHSLLFLVIPPLCYFVALLFKKVVLNMRIPNAANKTSILVLSTLCSAILVLTLKFTENSSLLGIGTSLISAVSKLTAEDALLFFLVRFVFTALAFDFFYAGGQVLPTMTVGYLLGLLAISLFSSVLPLSEQETTLFSLITMLSFYASVSDNYLTSFALSFSFGPFLVMVLPSLVCILFVFLLDRFVFDTPSLSRMIVNRDKESETYERMFHAD